MLLFFFCISNPRPDTEQIQKRPTQQILNVVSEAMASLEVRANKAVIRMKWGERESERNKAKTP